MPPARWRLMLLGLPDPRGGLTECPHRTSLRISKAMLDLRLSYFRVKDTKKMAR